MSLNPCCNGMKIEFNSLTCEGPQNCFNPCSNGMKIEYSTGTRRFRLGACLNPCSNGMKIEFVDVTSFEDYWRS